MIPIDYATGRRLENSRYCAECVEAGISKPRLVLAYVNQEYVMKCIRGTEHKRMVEIPSVWSLFNKPGQVKWKAKRGE